MKATYTIKRDDLKKKKYKAGTRSQKGQRPATNEYDLLRPIILKILTNTEK